MPEKYLWGEKNPSFIENIIIYLCIKNIIRKKNHSLTLFLTIFSKSHIDKQTWQTYRQTDPNSYIALNGCCGYLAVACSFNILWSSYLYGTYIYTHTFGE